jgi:hypothetical protein
MFVLTPFSQADLLVGVTDPDLQAGVCVAACDHWIAAIRRSYAISPEARLNLLRQYRGSVLAYQHRYARQRAVSGPQQARNAQGRQLGHDWDDQTTIMTTLVPMETIRQRLARDLADLGAAAAWTMRFAAGGGHAIAGYHGIASITPTLHEHRYHLFDPNLGEYVGVARDLAGMLDDLFRRVALYRTTTEMRRATGI